MRSPAARCRRAAVRISGNIHSHRSIAARNRRSTLAARRSSHRTHRLGMDFHIHSSNRDSHHSRNHRGNGHGKRNGHRTRNEPLPSLSSGSCRTRSARRTFLVSTSSSWEFSSQIRIAQPTHCQPLSEKRTTHISKSSRLSERDTSIT